MFVRGFVLDQISDVTEPARVANIPPTWLEFGEWDNTEEDPPEDFWRTLVADRGQHERNAPTFYPRACKEAIKRTIPGGTLETGKLMTEGQCSIIAEFLRRVQAVVWDRRLMRTKSIVNGSRRLGLVPYQAKRPDINDLFVCILYGCSVPVVLRRILKDENTIMKEEREEVGELARTREEAAIKIQRAFRDRKQRRRDEEARRRHQILAGIMAQPGRGNPSPEPAKSKRNSATAGSINPARSAPQLSPQRRDSFTNKSSNSTVPHRQSFAENLRANPHSPRSRHPSFSQQALQDLLNNPPVSKSDDNKFAGRDWRQIQLGEVIDTDEVRFVEADISVEEATSLLILGGPPNVVLIRENRNSRQAVDTFDYSDLNAYLLLVVGLARPDQEDVSSFNELAQKGREGKPIPLQDVKDLRKKEHKEPFIRIPHTQTLTKAMEIFGSGIHRIIVVKEGTMDVIGILSQLRLVRFFYQHGRNFPAVEKLYSLALKELEIGSRNVIAINGDRPLADALELMHNESITSLPVLDHHKNVIGNISQVDVR
ncbi:MAG: hypothetical protein Q9157_008763, partial [Trypethelium eluteriae]